LTFGDIVRVNYPWGEEAGKWRFENKPTQLQAPTTYQVILLPLCTEGTDADFNANYSVDATQPGTPLGAVTFDTPVLAAIPRTLHLSAGVILSNGTPYSYV